MRIGDCSSDVCSSDLAAGHASRQSVGVEFEQIALDRDGAQRFEPVSLFRLAIQRARFMAARRELLRQAARDLARAADDEDLAHDDACRVCVRKCLDRTYCRCDGRSVEHSSELTSLMRLTYAAL